MTKENFLGIRNPEWWSQETQALFGLCYPWMRGFARINEFYKKGYEVAIIPFENDYGWHFLDKKKSLDLAQKVVAEYLNPPVSVKIPRNKQMAASGEMIRFNSLASSKIIWQTAGLLESTKLTCPYLEFVS